MLRIDLYDTVRYGEMSATRGAVIVPAEGGQFILHIGQGTGGVKKIPLDTGCVAEITVTLCGGLFVARATIRDEKGGVVGEMDEPYGGKACDASPSEKQAIKSLIPEGFPRRVGYVFPGYSCPNPSASWEAAIKEQLRDKVSREWLKNSTEDWMAKAIRSLGFDPNSF